MVILEEMRKFTWEKTDKAEILKHTIEGSIYRSQVSFELFFVIYYNFL